MSRLEMLHAHAVLLRDRAAVLMSGDAEAQIHACNLHVDADEIDPKPQAGEEEAS